MESAASRVGLSKKTLDDYYYQLRLAEQFGFDFEFHKDSKIGVLRRFVKQTLANQIKAEDDPYGDIDQFLASSDSEEDKKYK